MKNARRHGRRLVSVLLLSIQATGCTDLVDTSKYFTVKMLGTLTAPESATGNRDPLWQEYTLEGIYLSPDPDSTDALSLYSDDPKAYKIIDRPQVIYKREIDAGWVDKKFDSIVVHFSPTVTAAGLYADDYSIDLLDGDVKFTDGFTVEKGQGLLATINVEWKNTITRDEGSDPPSETTIAPTFEVVISRD